MHEGYKAVGAMKSTLSNRELWIIIVKCLRDGVIVPTVWRSNCTNISQRQGICEKCGEKKCECSWKDGLKKLKTPFFIIILRGKCVKQKITIVCCSKIIFYVFTIKRKKNELHRKYRLPAGSAKNLSPLPFLLNGRGLWVYYSIFTNNRRLIGPPCD